MWVDLNSKSEQIEAAEQDGRPGGDDITLKYGNPTSAQVKCIFFLKLNLQKSKTRSIYRPAQFISDKNH